MRIRRIDNWLDASNYAAGWNRLLSEFEQASPFLTYDWFRLWWNIYGHGRELCLLIVEDNSGMQALAPFMVSRDKFFLGFPARIVKFIDNYRSCRIDLLTSQQQREESIMAIFQTLEDIGWDILYLNLISENSPNLSHILACTTRLGCKVCIQPDWFSPYLKIEKDWQSYLNSKSGKFRSFLRRRERHLSQIGTLHFDTFTRGKNINKLKEALFGVSSKGWAAREGTAIMSTPQSRGFYGDLLELANHNGWLYCNTLSLNGKPIAFEYNLQYNKKIYNLRLAYDEEYSNYSPGMVLKSYVLQEVFSRGFEEYDLNGDIERYKMQFASGLRRHLKLFIFHNRFYTKYFHWLPFAAKEKVKMVKPLRGIFKVSSKNEWDISVENILSGELSEKTSA